MGGLGKMVRGGRVETASEEIAGIQVYLKEWNGNIVECKLSKIYVGLMEWIESEDSQYLATVWLRKGSKLGCKSGNLKSARGGQDKGSLVMSTFLECGNILLFTSKETL